jgi:hypothetical protein
VPAARPAAAASSATAIEIKRPPSCNVPGRPVARASNLQAQFQCLRHRRGPKKAICAVAASILTAVYHMLRDGILYKNLGLNHFRRTSP